jgi:hypothetical protein
MRTRKPVQVQDDDKEEDKDKDEDVEQGLSDVKRFQGCTTCVPTGSVDNPHIKSLSREYREMPCAG